MQTGDEVTMEMMTACRFERTIQSIFEMEWDTLNRDELVAVAWAYYHFSIQFRENLEAACAMFPDDPKLEQLRREECDTDNLSPWPRVAQPGEKMNHDEFMRRLLTLEPIGGDLRSRLEAVGANYLAETRVIEPVVKALSIASYEDGGLEKVFTAMLRAPDWTGESLQAFRHFLIEHIKFDSDPEAGHGSLSRHLVPDDRISPVWEAFEGLLVGAVPRLAA